MDDYMLLKMRTQIMDNQECTTSCVARCGRLAELPRTTPDQLNRCFEQTCKCSDKSAKAELGEENEQQYDMDLLRQYYGLIHDRERVSYLILQQDMIDNILNLADAEEKTAKGKNFLNDENQILDEQTNALGSRIE